MPVLTCGDLSLKSCGYAYNVCVRSVLLYAYNAYVRSVLLFASEMWVATQEDVFRLNRNDMMMIRWICSAKLRDKVPSEELRSQFGSLVWSSSTYGPRHMA